MNVNFSKIGIVGAGAMGRGIAQIAAQAGSEVKLIDSMTGAAMRGKATIIAQWQKLQEKGRLDASTCETLAARLQPVGSVQ